LRRDHVQWLSSLGLPTLTLETGNDIVEEIPPFILADSAYANTKHVVTTFRTTEIMADNNVRALNQKLGAMRYHVENAFGILKARFQILQRPLECALEDIRFAVALIFSTLMLHNFLIDVNDGAFNEDELMQYAMEHTRLNGFDDDEDEDNPEERIEDENSTRAILLRHMHYISN